MTQGQSAARAPSAVEHDQPGLTDLRPMIPRSADNAWQKCEAIRRDLSGLIEQACLRRGIEALVLQSDPFQHPVWVKFESWMPCDGPALTARASMTITIKPTPYHRFETIHSVTWERQGRSATVDHLYAFGPAEIERMLDLLCSPPERGIARRRVNSILQAGQLRIHSWQLWRPNNKVVAVRRDYLKIASWWFTLAGVGLLFLSQQESLTTAVEQPSRFVQDAEPARAQVEPANPPPAASAPPQTTTEPASGQAARRADAAIEGELEESDNRLADGRYFDQYTYRKSIGSQVRIRVSSTQLDPYLIIGVDSEAGFRTLAENDDDGPADTDASVLLGPDIVGTLIVRVTSAATGGKGAYTVEVTQP